MSIHSKNELEYGAVIERLATDFVDVLLESSIKTNEQGGIVIAIVITWILCLVFGLLYFSRWDQRDRLQMIYAPATDHKYKVEIEDEKWRYLGIKATMAELLASRKSINLAFTEGKSVTEESILGEDHVEFQKRSFLIRSVQCLAVVFCAFSTISQAARSVEDH